MIKLSPPGGESSGGSLPDLTTGVEVEVGRDLDGNTLYEKIVDFGSGPNNGSKNVAHGISNLDTIVNSSFHLDNGTNISPIAYAGTSYARYQFTNTNVTAVTNANWTAYNGLAWIQYTKTV